MTVAVRRSLLDRGRRKMRSDYGKKNRYTGEVVRHVPERPPQRDCGITRCTSWPCRLWLVSGTVRCPHCHVAQKLD